MYLPIEYIYAQLFAWVLWYVIFPIVGVWLLYKLYKKLTRRDTFKVCFVNDEGDLVLVVNNTKNRLTTFVRISVIGDDLNILWTLDEMVGNEIATFKISNDQFAEISRHGVEISYQDDILNYHTEVTKEVKWVTSGTEKSALLDT